MDDTEKMETYVIDYYKEFECLGGSCPYTCCKGWRVQIDEETRKLYGEASGWEGVKLSLSVTNHPNVGPLLRQVCGRCPHLTKDKLCGFQCAGKLEYMPRICRLFPRLSLCYGEEMQEVTLELSCPETAGLFLKHLGRRHFVPWQNEIEVFTTLENNEVSFLQFLYRDREDILDYLWMQEDTGQIIDREDNPKHHLEEKNSYEEIFISENSYQSRKTGSNQDTVSKEKNYQIAAKMENIFHYVKQEYDCVLQQDFEKAKQITFADVIRQQALENEKQCKYLKHKSAADDASADRQSMNYSFYPIKMLNEFLYQWFGNPQRLRENSIFAEYVKKYRKLFGKLYETQADDYFNRNMQKMLEEHPEYEEIFVSYYSYLIQQEYLKAYEDYYMIGPVMMASFYTQFLMLLFLVEDLYQRKSKPDPMKESGQAKSQTDSARESGQLKFQSASIKKSEQARLLMAMEKALRHNYSLEEIILQKIREYSKEKLMS